MADKEAREPERQDGEEPQAQDGTSRQVLPEGQAHQPPDEEGLDRAVVLGADQYAQSDPPPPSGEPADGQEPEESLDESLTLDRDQYDQSGIRRDGIQRPGEPETEEALGRTDALNRDQYSQSEINQPAVDTDTTLTRRSDPESRSDGSEQQEESLGRTTALNRDQYSQSDINQPAIDTANKPARSSDSSSRSSGNQKPDVETFHTRMPTVDRTEESVLIVQEPSVRVVIGERGGTAPVKRVEGKGSQAEEVSAPEPAARVNQAPVANADRGQGRADSQFEIDVLANDTDGNPDDTPATFTLDQVQIVGNTGPAGAGLVTIVNNRLVFTPGTDFDALAEGETATVTVRYQMSDGEGASASSTATVIVTGVNATPDATDDTLLVQEGGSHTFTVADFGFSDPDTSDTLQSVTITRLPSAGDLTLNTVAVTAGQVITAAELATLTFTPASNAHGDSYADLQFTVSDGRADSPVRTLTIDVGEVNDAPTAQDKSLSINEDGSHTFVAADFGFSDVDTDDSLQSVTITRLTSSGSLTLNDTPVMLNQVITAATIGNLKFVPAANANDAGYANLQFTVSDGELSSSVQTITFDVDALNDAPTAQDKTLTIDEDGSHTFAASEFGFSDIDIGDTLQSVTITRLPSVGSITLNDTPVTLNQVITAATIGNLKFVPAANANDAGYANLQFTVSDGELSSSVQTITFDVDALNDAPTAQDKTLTIDEDGSHTFAASEFGFSDIDIGDTLQSVTITRLPSVGSLTLNDTPVTLNQVITAATIGNLKFAPAANANGAGYANLQFTVSDGELSSSVQTITFDVDALNDAPTAQDKTLTIDEDGSHTFAASEFGFSDIDIGDTLQSVTITRLPSVGSITLNDTPVTLNQVITAATIGNLKFVPAANANGAGYANLQFTVSDGELSSSVQTITFDVDALNDAPTAQDKTLTIDEDGSHTFAASEFGFSDIDIGDTLQSVTITRLPSVGSITLNDTPVTLNQVITAATIGNLKFVPAANANGAGYANLQFTVSDGELSSSVQTITFDVDALNDAPTAQDKTLTIDEDGSHTFAASEFGFSDIDIGDTLQSVTITRLPSVGSITLNDTPVTLNQVITAATIGNLKFVPAANANGAGYANLQFTVSDGELSSSVQTITFDVDALNDAPTAQDKTLTIDEDGSHTFAASEFGFSDIDIGDTLQSVTITRLPSVGSITLNDTPVTLNQVITAATIGNLKFVPAANANGAGYANLQFTVSDGELSSSVQTITFDVDALNDAPTAQDKTLTIDEDGSHTFAASEFGFSDIDIGDTLQSVTITRLPSVGSLTLNDTPVTLNQVITAATIGNLKFAPAANANGAGYANLQFTVSDGELSSSVQTITFDVDALNDAPTAQDKTLTIDEDGSHTFAASEFGFSDIDIGDTLQSVTITRLPSVGSITLNDTPVTLNQVITAATIGNLKFVPAANANGAGYANLQFTVSDGELSSSVQTITFDVDALNDAPTAQDKTLTIDEDGSHTFAASEFGFSDIDIGDTLQSVTITRLPSVGSITLNDTPVTLNQVITAATIGNLKFVPAANANGAGYANLQFTVSDGELSSSVQTITFDVDALNDAPTAQDKTLTIDEDGSHTFAASEFGFSDIDIGDTLQSVTITRLPSVGSLTLNDTPVTLNQVITAATIGNLKFVPAANANGAGYANLQFTVSDGELSSSVQTITFDVDAWNDAPTAQDKTLTIDEDGSHTFAASEFGFSDIDIGDTLQSVTITRLPSVGSITLNDTPVTLNQVITAATIGNLKFVPAANANGAGYANLQFTVSDGELSSSVQTITFDVDAWNDAPTAQDKTLTIDEDGSHTFAASEFGFSDIDIGDTLQSVTITRLPSVGSITLNDTPVTLNQVITAATIGNLKFVPAANANGAGYANLQFTVSDGELSSSVQTITFDVDALNDAPTAQDKTLTIDEDGSHTFAASEFGFSDIDIGDTLQSVTITRLPSVGSLTLNDTPVTLNQVITAATIGNLKFVPAANANGAGYANLQFTVSDGELSSSVQTITFDVDALNDAPTAQDKTLTIDVDGSHTFAASEFGFSDIDIGDTLQSVTITRLPSVGSITLNDTPVTLNQVITAATIGNLKFVPAANANGAGYANLQFTVSDGELSSSVQTITFDVDALNDAPTAQDKTLTIDEDGSHTFTATDFGFSDVDTDDSLQSVTITQLPSSGSLTLNDTLVMLNQVITAATIGNLKFVPAANANGAGYANLQFTVSDGELSSSVQTITFDVDALNDAPTAQDKTLTIDEDGSHTFAASEFGFSDIDTGDTLQSVTITRLPSVGSLTLNDTPVTLNQEITAANIGNLKYSPAANANGTGYADLQFTVSDGTESSQVQSLTFNVTPVNDAPTIIGSASAAYDFSAGTGTTASDLTGNDHSLTLSGNTFWEAGYNGTGSALSLDGTVDGGGEISGIQTGGAMTLSAAVRMDSFQNFSRIFAFGGSEGTSATDMILLFNASTTNDLRFWQNTPAGTKSLDIDNFFVAGEWVHITVTIEDTGLVSIYKDGVLAGSENLGLPELKVRDLNYIGKSNFSDRPSVDGAIDDVAIFSHALDATQVSELYHASSLADFVFSYSVNENVTNGTVVGQVSASDVDAGDTLTYSLLDDTGGRFAIDATTGDITVADGTRMDHETDASHTLRVRVTDSGDLSTEQDIVIQVQDVNEAPEVSGAVTVTAPDNLDAHTVTEAFLLGNATDQDGDTLSVQDVSINGVTAHRHDFQTSLAAGSGGGVSVTGDTLTLTGGAAGVENVVLIDTTGGGTRGTDLHLDFTVTPTSQHTTRNNFIVFDYVDANNYKAVGSYDDGGTSLWVVQQWTNGVSTTLAEFNSSNNSNINVSRHYEVDIINNRVSLTVNGVEKVAHQFSENISDGELGVMNTGSAITNYTLNGADWDIYPDNEHAVYDNNDGTWTILPGDDLAGDLTLDYNVSDGELTTAATAVIPVDRTPDASIELSSTTGISDDVLPVETTAGGDTLTVTSVNDQAVASTGTTSIAGEFGTLDIAADGSWTYNLDAAYASADLDSDLIARWTFDEASGTTVADSSTVDSIADDGTLNGATFVSDGISGSAVAFDGSNDRIDVANSTELNIYTGTKTAQTISLAFKVDPANDLTGTQVLYEQGGVSNGFNIYIRDGNLYVGAWSEDNSWNGAYVSTSLAGLEDGWHSVSLVLDATSATASARTLTGYLDGIDFGTKTGAKVVGHHSSAIAFGGMSEETQIDTGDLTGDGNYFQGEIDEARIYNRALSDTEVRVLGQIEKSETFTYEVSDGTHTSTSTLAIDVQHTLDSTEGISGTVGDETLTGTAFGEQIDGLAGMDTLIGNGGDDFLIGGAGNDTLTGGTGSDTFVWIAGHEGTTSSVAIDTITDFNATAGGDAIDLSLLLSGETETTLDQYLNVNVTGGNTEIEVKPDGASGDVTQKIVLQGVDLSGLGDNTAILNTLLQNGNLHMDG